MVDLGRHRRVVRRHEGVEHGAGPRIRRVRGHGGHQDLHQAWRWELNVRYDDPVVRQVLLCIVSSSVCRLRYHMALTSATPFHIRRIFVRFECVSKLRYARDCREAKEVTGSGCGLNSAGLGIGTEYIELFRATRRRRPRRASSATHWLPVCSYGENAHSGSLGRAG